MSTEASRFSDTGTIVFLIEGLDGDWGGVGSNRESNDRSGEVLGESSRDRGTQRTFLAMEDLSSELAVPVSAGVAFAGVT